MVTTLRRATVCAVFASAAVCAPHPGSADELMSVAEQQVSLERSDASEPAELLHLKRARVADPVAQPVHQSLSHAATLPRMAADSPVRDRRPLPPPRQTQRLVDSAMPAGRSPRWLAERIGVVMAVFLALVLVQRWLPRKHPSLPHGMVQVCGKVPLDSKQSLHLVRLGQRLLVLLEAPQGMQCVAEITDPSEVRRLLSADEGDSENRPVVNVRQVLSSFRQRASSLA